MKRMGAINKINKNRWDCPNRQVGVATKGIWLNFRELKYPGANIYWWPTRILLSLYHQKKKKKIQIHCLAPRHELVLRFWIHWLKRNHDLRAGETHTHLQYLGKAYTVMVVLVFPKITYSHALSYTKERGIPKHPKDC